MRAGVGGERERRTSRRSRAACPGVEEREDEGDLGPSSSGPQQKLEPGISDSSSHWTCARACTCRRVPAPPEKSCPALLGKSCVALRSKAWARLFLPARARRPGWSVTHRSAGAAPSRNGRPSFAARARARPVPGILKAGHLPNCDGPTSRPPRKRPCRLILLNVLTMARGRASPSDPPHLPMGSPRSQESHGPQSSHTLPRAI